VQIQNTVGLQKDCVGVCDGSSEAYTERLVPAAPEFLNGSKMLTLLRAAQSGTRSAETQFVDGRRCWVVPHPDGFRGWIDCQTGFPVAIAGAPKGSRMIHGLAETGDANLTIHFQRSNLNVAGMRGWLFDLHRLDPALASELR
jgi:hypothetical protein